MFSRMICKLVFLQLVTFICYFLDVCYGDPRSDENLTGMDYKRKYGMRDALTIIFSIFGVLFGLPIVLTCFWYLCRSICCEDENKAAASTNTDAEQRQPLNIQMEQHVTSDNINIDVVINNQHYTLTRAPNPTPIAPPFQQQLDGNQSDHPPPYHTVHIA